MARPPERAQPPPAGRALFRPRLLRLRLCSTPLHGRGSLNAAMTLEPENPSKNWIGVRRMLLPHSYTMCSTRFFSQGNNSKSMGLQEAGVCGKTLPGSYSAPLPSPQSVNIPMAISWSKMMESGRSKEGKEATKGTETSNGTQVQKVDEGDTGPETMIVAQPLMGLRSLLGIRCHLSLCHLHLVLNAEPLHSGRKRPWKGEMPKVGKNVK